MNVIKLVFDVFKRSTTAKSGVWYLISNFLLKGMAFITIPVFTRLLTVEGYGIASVFVSFVGIFTIITGADLHAGIGRAQIDFEKDYKTYLSSVLSLSILFFLGSFTVVLIFQKPLSTSTELPLSILIVSVITGYFGFVLKYLNYHFLFKQDYKKRTVLQISKAISQVALSILLVFLISQNKYMGKIYGQLIISFIFAVIAFLIIFKYGRKLFFLKAWKYAMKIGIPLIPHSLSGIILAQFDRMAIQSLVGSFETGLYSFAYNIGMIPLVVLGATNSAWVPWFYKQKAQENTEKIRNAVRLFTSGFLIITLGIMVFGPELALIMAPSNYHAGLRIVPVIVLSYFFQFLYTIYVNFAFYKKKTLAISIGTMMAGGLNIALNVSLIPVFGYEIAAWTTVISYFCLFIFHWFNVNILLKDKTISLKGMLIFAIIVSVVSLQQYLINFIFTPFSLYERLIRFGVSSIIIAFLLVYIFNRSKKYFSTRESAGE